MPKAAVTGCTGFVGSELTYQLLSQGWHVVGVVRDSPESERSKSLKQACASVQNQGKLELVVAGITDVAALTTAFQGASVVFHCASPFVIDVPDPQKDLVDPAVQGTRAVMQAAAANKATVKKVVLTSSVAAVHDCHCKQLPSLPSGLYSEADFNETSTLDKEPYWVSKVAAEKEGWQLSQELGVPLLTILPEFIMGPVRSKEAAAGSLSVGFMRAFLEAPDGKVPSGSWIFSDVREVAAAHILAATVPHASGRYIVASTECLSARDVTTILKDEVPELDIPDGEEASTNYNLTNTKAVEELGLKLRDVRSTLGDMARSLIAHGIAHPSPTRQPVVQKLS